MEITKTATPIYSECALYALVASSCSTVMTMMELLGKGQGHAVYSHFCFIVQITPSKY